MDYKFVSATCHLKNDKVVLVTFIEDENLFIVNNLGNKQLLLGKDKSPEFDMAISSLKEFHQVTHSVEKLLDANKYKESETAESVRLKRKIKPS
jgi:hypothetical protein